MSGLCGRHVRITAVVSLMLAVGMLGFAEAVTYTDGTFSDADWTSLKIRDTTSGQTATFTAYQVLTGGHPDAYRYVQHHYDTGGIVVAHMRAAAIYDPSTQGAVATVDYSYDLIHLNPPPNQAVGYGLLVFQDGLYYRASTDAVFDEEWQAFGQTGLEALDFNVIGDVGPPHPDFTASGSPFQLGYRTSNTSNGGWLTRESGLDNWCVTVNPTVVTVGESERTQTWGQTKAKYR